MDTLTELNITVKPMNRLHIASARQIEHRCIGQSTEYTQWCMLLNTQGMMSLVALAENVVAGFLVLEWNDERCRAYLATLTVDLKFRRRGVGTLLLDRAKDAIHASSLHDRMTVIVHERNLDAQLFFNKHRFRATKTLTKYCEETGEDAYKFVWWKRFG